MDLADAAAWPGGEPTQIVGNFYQADGERFQTAAHVHGVARLAQIHVILGWISLLLRGLAKISNALLAITSFAFMLVARLTPEEGEQTTRAYGRGGSGGGSFSKRAKAIMPAVNRAARICQPSA